MPAVGDAFRSHSAHSSGTPEPSADVPRASSGPALTDIWLASSGAPGSKSRTRRLIVRSSPQKDKNRLGPAFERAVIVVETEGLTHVHLYVKDLERSLSFYRNVFGLVEMYRDGPHMVFLRPPGTADTITLNERPDFDGSRGGIEHIGFRLKDKSQLERAIQEVERAGGRLLDTGARGDGGAYAYVEDPDGHMIEL